MNWQIFSGLFEPLTKLIDETHTSTEEKGKLKNAIAAMQAELSSKLIDYKTAIIKAQKSILVAEANGHSWMQRNWRPLTMLIFVGLVVGDLFGLTAYRLPDDAWQVIKIGLGGYVVGRSIEKVTPTIFGNGKTQRTQITEKDFF